jgi:hypothetical protein
MESARALPVKEPLTFRDPKIESHPMSKIGMVGVALVTAIAGFALGHSVASQPGSSSGASSIASGTRYEVPRPAGPPSSWNEILDALSEHDAFTRANRISELIPRLGPESAPQASAALESRSLDLGAADVDLLVRFWGRHDPAGAVQWSAYSAPSAFRLSSVASSIELLAQSDPSAAVNFTEALALAQNPAAEVAEVALIRGWFWGGGEGLEQYIADRGTGYSRQRALGEVSRQLVKRDGADAAIAWARQAAGSEDIRFNRAVYRQLGSQLAQLDPASAVAWCEEVCGGELGDGVMTLVAQRWASQDGPGAMEWLSTMPPSFQRDLAIKGAFRGWWRRDARGFRLWAESMTQETPPAWMEPLLENWGGAVGRVKPQQGFEVARLIQDQETRERTYAAIVVAWHTREPGAAAEWLEQSTLSDPAKARIRAVPSWGVIPEPEQADTPEGSTDSPPLAPDNPIPDGVEPAGGAESPR